MNIAIQEKIEKNVKSIHLYMKVRDEFNASIKDTDGHEIIDYEGYVPSFMPGDHYGDYLILDIELDTGMITNWRKDIGPRLQKFFDDQGQ